MVGIEPLDGVEQADARHLHQIVERLATVGESARTTRGQPQRVIGDLVAQPGIVGDRVAVEGLQQPCLVVLRLAGHCRHVIDA